MTTNQHPRTTAGKTNPGHDATHPTRRRSTWHRALVLTLVVLTILVAVGYLLVPFRTSTQVPCGGGGGTIAWEFGGANRQRDQAAADKARMQEGLDGMQNDPAVATTPMGKELIEDAQDAITTANSKQAAIDTCSTDAVARIERSTLGVVAVVAAYFSVTALLSWLRGVRRRRRERRQHQIDGTVAPQHCPHCGALLDDPLGCWNCGGFVDGDQWRFPAQTPPDQARRITGAPPPGA